MPRYGPDDEQVRDATYTVHTPSLEEYGNEPVPDEIVRDLLVDQWHETDAAPRPTIMVKTDFKQADLQRHDVIAVAVDHYGLEPVGYRHEFMKLEIPIAIEIHTVASRQRLWNLMAEVRRIILKFFLATRPYQSNYFDGFRPDYEGRASYYSGTISIRLTADMLPWATMVVGDMASPNADPAATTGD